MIQLRTARPGAPASLVLSVSLSSMISVAGAVPCDQFCGGYDIVPRFSTLPGHESSMVPGTSAVFTGFGPVTWSREHPTAIALSAQTDQGDALIVSSMKTGYFHTVAAMAGDPSPIPGAAYASIGEICGINSAGAYAFSARLAGVPAGSDSVVIVNDGSGDRVVAREGEPAPGLADPDGAAGDEIYGDTLDSVRLLADGRVAFRAAGIGGLPAGHDGAIYLASADATGAVFQTGLALPGSGDATASIASGRGRAFRITPDGGVLSFIAGTASGDMFVTGAPGSLAAAFASGASPDGTAPAVAAVGSFDLNTAGEWFVSLSLADGTAWAERSTGEVHRTGMIVEGSEGSVEIGNSISGVTIWRNSFDSNTLHAFLASQPGGGETLITSYFGPALSSGGCVAGYDTEASAASFTADGLSAGGVYDAYPGSVEAEIVRTADGAPLGRAVLQWQHRGFFKPAADLVRPCAVLDLADITAFLTAFLAGDSVADFAQPYGVIDLADITQFITSFQGGTP